MYQIVYEQDGEVHSTAPSMSVARHEANLLALVHNRQVTVFSGAEALYTVDSSTAYQVLSTQGSRAELRRKASDLAHARRAAQ